MKSRGFKNKNLFFVTVLLMTTNLLSIAAGYYTVPYAIDLFYGARFNYRNQVSRTGSIPARLLYKCDERLFQKTQKLVLQDKTIDVLRRENIKQQGYIDSLGKEIELFKRVIRGQNESQGLAIGRFEIRPGSENDYSLSLDVIQISGSERVEGTLSIQVFGFDTRKETTKLSELPIHLGNTEGEDHISLNFTNFQTVKVAVRLPKRFEPTEVQVTAQFSGSKNARIEKRFPWETRNFSSL